MSDIPDNILQGADRCVEESRSSSFAKIYARYPEIIFELSARGRVPFWQKHDNLVVIAPQTISAILARASAAELPVLANQVVKNPTTLAIALANGIDVNLFQHHFFRTMVASDLSPMSMLLDAGIDLSFLAKDTGRLTAEQRATKEMVRDGSGLAMMLINGVSRNLDECEILIRKMAKNGYPLDIGKPVIKCIGNKDLKDKSFDIMILLMRSGYQFQQDDIDKASKYLDPSQIAEVTKNSIKIAVREAVAKQEQAENESQATPQPVPQSRRNRIDM